MGHTKGGMDKGKGIATSSNVGSEIDVLRGKRRQRKKAAGKETNVKAKPTPASLLKKMKAMEFVQTKWADQDLLHELGIYEETHMLFHNMGLRRIFLMEFPAYKDQTLQFLATLKYYDDTSKELSDESRASITFKIDSTVHELTLHQLAASLGIPEPGEVCSLRLDVMEAENVWRTIADGPYVKGVSKAATIRHPAIRYAHKFLAHTLFARRETGAVKEDELAFLIEAIKPILVTCENGDRIIGQNKKLNLAHYYVRRLLEVQEWVHTTRDSTPKISIGGLVTPILVACGVDLGDDPPAIERLDAPCLVRQTFLVGRCGNSYGYRINLSQKDQKKIVLPHHTLTSFDNRNNVVFRPKPFQFYNRSIHGTFTPIRCKTGANVQPENEDQDEQQTEEVFGSARYYYEPYDEPISEKALKAVHVQNNYLRRWNKHQDKKIASLKGTVKGLYSTVKKLVKLVTGAGSSRGGHKNEGEGDAHESEIGEKESEAADEPTRHSYHGDSSTHLLALQPARPSAYEKVYERRPKANKRKATRSPSTSSSNNPCSSLGTSSFDDF